MRSDRIASVLRRAYGDLIGIIAFPALAAGFFASETGSAYGIGRWRRLKLLLAFHRNGRKIKTASLVMEHVAIATQLLRIPPEVEGAVVECGTFKGGSAANLSLVCDLVGRELHIYDSFEGLPEPGAQDEAHVVLIAGQLHSYGKGSFAGSLEEVTENLTRWGAIDVCRLHRGFFSETLPAHDAPCVAVFVDVDYVDSMDTCVRWLWPALRDGCPFFIHEAHHMDIAARFFDREWWAETLGSEPPGLVGAGSGLGLRASRGSFQSALGYTIKGPVAMESLEFRPQTG